MFFYSMIPFKAVEPPYRPDDVKCSPPEDSNGVNDQPKKDVKEGYQ